MKQLLTLSLALCSFLGLSAQSLVNFHSFNVRNIQGDTISLAQYAGKKIMVVNTASYCAYTYQYGQLESLYQQYESQNFEILGFPCNDFGNQEPGTDSSVAEFCTNTYDVHFPMMSIIHIRQGDTAEVYKWLQRGDLNGVADAAVSWNFNKFLIDEQGNWVNHFPSTVNPSDTAIVNWILSDSGEVTSATLNPDIQIEGISVSSHGSQLTLRSAIQQVAHVDLISMDGKIVVQHSAILLPGENKISLASTGLSSGMYCIRVHNGKYYSVKKINIQD